MLFTEPLFLAFFALVFCVYWSLSRNRHRKAWILACSYFFYAAWDWRFCGLILASTLIDYAVGLALGRERPPLSRRFWLLVSLVGNLGLLGFFKYFNFFVESANSVMGLFGLGGIRTLHIVLPVGISFYTFQTLSYSIDVYRRRIEPVRSFLDFAMFVSFFPQLVMGPILRAVNFLPQLEEKKRFEDVRVRAMLALFLVGFFKKACVSDNLAPFVDEVYADPDAHDAVGLWLAALSFSVQIYCDFSGYADMAIALAGLLGYRVEKNFDFPFFSRDMSEFWRRWHISFSTWMRDYLYIPMGGSRFSRTRTLWNLMFTMLVSGLWHGAGWNFVTWGALHGLALVVHRTYRGAAGVPAGVRALLHRLGPLLVFYWFTFTCVFFRAESFGDAFTVAGAVALFRSPGAVATDPLWLLFPLPLLAVHWLFWRLDPVARVERIPSPVFAAGFGLAAALAASLVRVEYRPFIYFQF